MLVTDHSESMGIGRGVLRVEPPAGHRDKCALVPSPFGSNRRPRKHYAALTKSPPRKYVIVIIPPMGAKPGASPRRLEGVLDFPWRNFAPSVSHPGFRGTKPGRESSPSVLGSCFTHMMTHGTETNVTSLIYNRLLYKIVK
jgi:hypothetical protein